MAGFHFVTDLDGTWLPLPEQVPDLRRLETALRARPEVVLTFATGRTFSSALEAIARWDLMPPHHLICDVGTALFHRAPGGGWVEDRAWADQVLAVWEPDAADRLMARLPASVWPQAGVVPIRRLALRRADGEDGEDMGRAGRDLAEACRTAGLTAHILPSHDVYFDVLPRGVHKGAALAFLQTSQHLPRPIVACGDSANDFGLLDESDYPIFMRGGLPDSEVPAPLLRRIRRADFPGPGGIHRVLSALGLLEGSHVG